MHACCRADSLEFAACPCRPLAIEGPVSSTNGPGPGIMTERRAPGRGRRFLQGLLSQLVLIAITLAATELALRVLDLRFLRDGARPGYAFVYRYDSDLGWAPVPNARAEFTGARTVSVQNN